MQPYYKEKKNFVLITFLSFDLSPMIGIIDLDLIAFLVLFNIVKITKQLQDIIIKFL